MPYCIYTSQGFILCQRDFGEADKIFSFYTKDYGRIEAVAQGVRYLKSKLRYNLNGFAVLRLSFVSTSSEYWRLIDVEEIFPFLGIKNNPQKLNVFLKIISLLEKMIKGREKDLLLWGKLEKIFRFLEETKIPPQSNGFITDFEIFSFIHILACLGYLKDGEKWSRLPLKNIASYRPVLVSLIKEAISASQL